MNNEQRKEIFNIIKALLVLVILATIFSMLGSSCVSDDDTPVAVEHVLLVYLAGDNNLSNEAGEKLSAIAKGFDGASCRRVLIYVDSQDETPSLIELSGSKQNIIEHYDTENSADAQVFRRVIAKAKSLYPEARFNLLIFSHASGWLPEGTYASPRSILMDGNDEMELSDFAAAIPDHSFESIVFEACHMAGIEVFFELKDKAQYIAASSAEIVSPGFTPLYSTAIINELVKGNTETFLKAAFEHFDWGTLSLINTSALEDLASFVKSNCDFDKEIQINDIQYFDRGNRKLFCDFEDYYSRLLATEEQKEELNNLISNCVIWKAATPTFMEGYNGFAIHQHSGLTGYIPQERYPFQNEAYKRLNWYKAVNK